MGFRAAWLKHEGFLSVHTEDFLHIVDRIVPDKPFHLLLIGAGNGGGVQVWREVMPEGSTVTVIDSDPKAADLGLDIVIVDVQDQKAVRKALAGSWFNIIIDATGSFMPSVWPFLRPGGVLVVDRYRKDILNDLVRDIGIDVDSHLPTEEIMSVLIFTNVVGIEKRNPRVVPYLEVIQGKDDPIVKEYFYQSRGAKRLTPTPQTVP
jgi:hypothetical protein